MSSQVFVVERWKPGNIATKDSLAAFESVADACGFLTDLGAKPPPFNRFGTWTQQSAHFTIVPVKFISERGA